MRRRGVVLLIASLVPVLLVLAAAGGCEAIVGTALPSYQCTGTDPSSCPAGSYCSGSACVPCDPAHCGGSIDAALDAPADSPGFDTSPLDTSPADVPRADSLPPFDGSIDATDATDAATEVGSEAGDALTSGDAPEGGPEAGCAAIGCACTGSSGCLSGICGNADALGSTFTMAHGASCTEACCTAADCPSGYVCYGPGNAGSYCVSSAALGRPATLGSAAPGELCLGDGDCRSGICQMGLCVDLCCSDSDCNNGTSCSLDTAGIDGSEVFACLATLGAVPAHGACASPSQCASGDCESSTCRPRCCSLASCTASGFNACELEPEGSDSVYECSFPTSPPSGGSFGASCVKATDCASRTCDTAGGTCSAACCLDADCSTFGNYVCRPAGASPYNLICTKS